MALEEDIKIIMTAEDKASDEVKAAAKRINDEYREFNKVNMAVGRASVLSNRELFATARVMSSIGNIAGRVTDIYTKYNIMQLRIGDTARRVSEAQEDLRTAILQTGPGSDEAIEAARRLQDAQEAQKRAADESKFAMIGFGLETLTAAGSIITALPRFAQLAAALKGIGGAAAGATLTGALSGMTAGTAAGAGAAATAGAVGAGVGGGVVSGFSNTFAVTSIGDKIAGTNTTQILADQFKAADKQLTGGIFSPIIDFFSGEMFRPGGSQGGGAPHNDINITVNGSDPQATADELARQLALAQVGR